MKLLQACLAVVCLASCDVIEVDPGMQSFDKDFSHTNTKGGGCDGSGTAIRDSLAVNLAGPLAQFGDTACFKTLTITPTATVTTLATSTQAGETCTGGAKGNLTGTLFTASFTDNKGAVQTLELACDATVDLAVGQANLQTKMQTCLDANKEGLSEFIRKGMNTKKRLVDIAVAGSCSADACFQINWKLHLDITGKLAPLGGCK